MSEPTKKQINMLESDLADGIFDSGEQQDTVRALLDAYEERGREIERLRAEVERHRGRMVRDMDLRDQAKNAVAEVERLRTCGVIELMLVNPNVDSWVREHELRAEQAEAQLAKVIEALEWMRNLASGVGKRGSCACHSDVMILNLHAEVERLRAEVFDAQARYDALWNSDACEDVRLATARAEQAEGRLAGLESEASHAAALYRAEAEHRKELAARLAKVVETAREVLAQGSLEYRAEHSQRCDCPTCRLYHLADAAQPEEKRRG